MIIGLMGQAGSGKDTVADYVIQYFKNIGYTIEKVPFARELKRITRELFHLSEAQVNTQEGKMAIDPRYGKTPRTLLQEVGTALRGVHDTIWVEAALRQQDKNSVFHIIISDVRYRNEVEAINRAGGIVIRIVREDFQMLSGTAAQHASETEQLSIPDTEIYGTLSAKSGQIAKLQDDAVLLLTRPILYNQK